MIRVGVSEARNKFSARLDRVERGEAVTNTGRGKPVARLVADDSQAALQRMRARASEIGSRPQVWITPGLNFATSGLRAAAWSAVSNTSLVFAGSMMASTHSRAAA
jgi:prevent-host-death family protein